MTETLGGAVGSATDVPLSRRIEELAEEAAREIAAELGVPRAAAA